MQDVQGLRDLQSRACSVLYRCRVVFSRGPIQRHRRPTHRSRKQPLGTLSFLKQWRPVCSSLTLLS